MVVGIAGLNEFWDCSMSNSHYLINADHAVEYEKIRHIYSRTDVGRLPPRSEMGQKVKTS
jgi:hypothetical protein